MGNDSGCSTIVSWLSTAGSLLARGLGTWPVSIGIANHLGGIHVFKFASVGSWITWFISNWDENDFYVKLSKFTNSFSLKMRTKNLKSTFYQIFLQFSCFFPRWYFYLCIIEVMPRQIYPLTAIRVSTLALKLNFWDGLIIQFECQIAYMVYFL